MISKLTLMVAAFAFLLNGVAGASSCQPGFTMYAGPCSIGPVTFDFSFADYEESNVDYGVVPAITPINNFPWQVGFSLEGRTIATYPSIYTPGFGFYTLNEFFTVHVPAGLKTTATDPTIIGAHTVGNAEFSDAESFYSGGPDCPSGPITCQGFGMYVLAEVGSAFDEGQIASLSWDSTQVMFNLRPVPEPAPLPLVATGIAFLGTVKRRKRAGCS